MAAALAGSGSGELPKENGRIGLIFEARPAQKIPTSLAWNAHNIPRHERGENYLL